MICWGEVGNVHKHQSVQSTQNTVHCRVYRVLYLNTSTRRAYEREREGERFQVFRESSGRAAALPEPVVGFGEFETPEFL